MAAGGGGRTAAGRRRGGSGARGDVFPSKPQLSKHGRGGGPPAVSTSATSRSPSTRPATLTDSPASSASASAAEQCAAPSSLWPSARPSFCRRPLSVAIETTTTGTGAVQQNDGLADG